MKTRSLRLEPLENRRVLSCAVPSSTTISVPSATSGAVDVGAADCFSFTANAGARYNLTTELGTLTSFTMTLFDTDGVSGISGESGDGSPLSWRAPSWGEYFVEIAADGGSAGSYTLDLGLVADEHRPEPHLATPISIPSSTPGEINFYDDNDVFSFDATAGTVYAFSVDRPTPASLPPLELVDSDGTSVLDDTYTGPSTIYWNAPSSGTRYIRVLYGSFGDYDLNATVVNYTDDHSNVAILATPLSVPSTTAGIIETNGDQDFFSFEAIEGTLYAFSSNLFGTSLSVYDTDGVTPLDDTLNIATLFWTAPSSDTYHLGIQQTGSTTGSYSIAITGSTYTDDHSNLHSGATAVSVPSVPNGNLEVTGDVDVFSFSASAGTIYRLAPTMSPLSSVSPRLRVLGTDGTSVLLSVFSGAIASWLAPASGTFYLTVNHGGATEDTGAYSIDISTVVYSDDHGNALPSATTETVPFTENGSINVLRDVDVFSFAATKGSLYRLNSTKPTASSPKVRQRLRDANGEEIFDVSAPELFWVAPSDGVYYVSLRAQNFAAAQTGGYIFSLSEVTYGDDHGRLASLATPVSVPSTTGGSINVAGDIDVFSFLATAGIRYQISALSNAISFTTLDLEAADGTAPVIYDYSAGGIGRPTRAYWVAPTSGTYFVKVRHHANNQTGTYTLDVAPTSLSCDFAGNFNGCDIDDLESLYAGTNGAPIPLTNSLITQWLSDASHPANPLKQNPIDEFVYGDVNLNGEVDSIDLGLLLNKFNDATNLGWRDGNLNVDAIVDSIDLGLLLNNFGFNSSPDLAASSASLAAPPSEPAQPAVDFSFAHQADEDDEDATTANSAAPFWWL